MPKKEVNSLMYAANTEIKISVIIPVYNMEKYIRQCINSILRQTLHEIEIICIDDGSADRSQIILNEFAKTHKNIHMYAQDHKFAGAARNLGLQYAQGEFVAFMDADDYYEADDVLEYLYVIAKRERVSICGGSMVEYDADNEEEFRYPKQAYLFDRNERRTFVNVPLCFGYTRFIFDRIFLLRNHLCFPDYERFQDPPFFCRALLCANEYYVCHKEIYHARCIHKSHKYSLGAIKGIGHGVVDVLEILETSHIEHQKLYLDLLQHSLAPCIKFFYKWANEKTNTNKAMNVLIRIRNTMTFREAFDALGWEHECNLTPSWVEKRYEELKALQEMRINEIISAKKIAIYGAGHIGKLAMSYVRKICKREVEFFIVTSKEGNPDNIDSTPVYGINEINVEGDILLIVAMNQKWHKEVCERLRRVPIKSCIYWNETMSPVLWSDILYGCI